jgi:DNA-binding transcriptional MocR family regulator
MTPPSSGQKSAALYALHWMPGLTPSARVIGAWLVWHANASTGRCDPGQSRLAKETGYSRRTIQEAVACLMAEGVIRRQLRSQRSSSYEIKWKTLAGITSKFEELAREGDGEVVTPSQRQEGGRRKLRLAGADIRAPQAQETAPKHSEENTRNEHVFPVGTLPEGSGAILPKDAADRILGIKQDQAFLAVLDRGLKNGDRFHRDDVDRVYERIERICEANDHSQGDPLGGRAYRLLTTDLAWETA